MKNNPFKLKSRELSELPAGSTPLIRMALLEAIDSVKGNLDAYELLATGSLKDIGTSGRERYYATRKEYKRRLAGYRKLLKQLGGKVKDDEESAYALQRSTEA